MTAEQKIHEARAAKVEKLVAWLILQKVTARVAAAIKPYLWNEITTIVGVSKLRHEDDTTRLMVIAELQVRETAAFLTGCTVENVHVVKA